MRVPCINRLADLLLVTCLILGALLLLADEQPVVRLANADPVWATNAGTTNKGSRGRDYLAAWQSLNRALDGNDASLLDADFTGIAREKLSNTIADQQTLGLKTRYQGRQTRRQSALLLARRTIDRTAG